MSAERTNRIASADESSDDGAITYGRYGQQLQFEVLRARGTRHLFSEFHERFAVSINRGRHGGDVFYRGTISPHAPKTVFLLEPGELHRTLRNTGPVNVDVLFFDSALLRQLAPDMGTLHWRALVTDEDALFTDLERFFDRVVGHDLDGDAAVADAMASLLEHAAEELTTGRRTRIGLRRAIELMIEHPTIPSLTELASAAGGATPFHFLRSFSRQLGITPHQYALRVRVARARKLLSAGRSAAEVAVDVGFGDQSHFHRHFRRIVGVTPGAYARATAAKRHALAATPGAQ